jgi:hypothetical protein
VLVEKRNYGLGRVIEFISYQTLTRDMDRMQVSAAFREERRKLLSYI